MANSIQINVFYPKQGRRMVLRNELDWTHDIAASASNDVVTQFQIETDLEVFDFKPILLDGDQERWSHGRNYTAYPVTRDKRDLYPSFYGNPFMGEVSDIQGVDTATGRFFMRVYTPPGYHDNPLKRYPVLYMQDGGNLFFDDEAFRDEWEVDENMNTLNVLSLIDKTIVVGVYPRNRNYYYVQPGYEDYGRALTGPIKTAVDQQYRTLTGAANTAVMGSSLGGVVSLFLAWQYPTVFGKAACMSSTFWYENDLMARVASEPKRPIRLYLDSGVERDNFEPTLRMRDLLLLRGYELGKNLLYLNFPDARHSESYWRDRLEIPFQFLFGKTP